MLRELNDVVDDAVQLESPKVADPTRTPYDISKIDFERLQQEFARAEKQQETFDLKERIENCLARMLRANPKRVDLYEKYQGIIRDYNREKDAAEIARIFEQLMALDRGLDEEERRFVREGFETDEQLAIFDLLRKESLGSAEIERIRQAAKDLLPRLEQRKVLADYWDGVDPGARGQPLVTCQTLVDGHQEVSQQISCCRAATRVSRRRSSGVRDSSGLPNNCAASLIDR